MKAIQVCEFGAPEVMKVATLPEPQPDAAQVLVRVAAAGVNPVDVYIRSGQYGRLPSLPYTPGSDGAGMIVALGSGIGGNLQVGQRLWLSGCNTGSYAGFAVCDARDVHPLPTWMSYAQGAALGVPYMTAFRALIQRGGAKPGETVLIHGGTGGTGVAAVQLALSSGLRVFATGGSAAGRAMLAKLGAEVFDHGTADYWASVRDTSGGVDLIVEMLANQNLDRDLEMLAKGGRIVIVGSRGRVEINPRHAMIREAEIRGVMASNATWEERAEAVTAIMSGIEKRELSPVVQREFPMSEAPGAHQAVMAPGHCGKVVLNCES